MTRGGRCSHPSLDSCLRRNDSSIRRSTPFGITDDRTHESSPLRSWAGSPLSRGHYPSYMLMLFSFWFQPFQDTVQCLLKPFSLPHPNPLPEGEGAACPLMTAYPQNVSCLRFAPLREVMGEPWRHDPWDPCHARPCKAALDSCCSLSPKAFIGDRNDREPAPAWFRQGAHQSATSHS